MTISRIQKSSTTYFRSLIVSKIPSNTASYEQHSFYHGEYYPFIETFKMILKSWKLILCVF